MRAAIVITDLNIEALRSFSHLPADIAQPDYAQFFAREVRLERQVVAPYAGAACAVEHGDLADDAKQQREGVIGDAVVVGTRAIHHGDAARLRRIARDVFVARA